MKTFINYSENELYKIALYGMNSGVRIDARDYKILCAFNRKAQRKINLLKQKKVIELSNQIFKQFHHSDLAKSLCDFNHTYEGFFCTLSLKDLGITKEEIKKIINE